MTKGTNLIPLVKMARKQRPAFQAVLPPETQDFIESYLLTGSWYPELHLEQLLVAADRVHGTGDLTICRKLGRYLAETNLQTIYKSLFVAGDPKSTLSLLPRLWSLSHDTGTVAVAQISPGVTRLVLVGFEAPGLALCASIAGWIEGAVGVAGGQGQVAEERCRLRGDDDCTFSAHWTMSA